MGVREKLEVALRSFDDQTRHDRIERIVWLAEYSSLPSAVMGRAETLHLLGEAREVFVQGQHAAALLLAVAVIEHSLVEELQLRGLIKGSPSLSEALVMAEKNAVLPSEWFPEIKELVLRRNPFAHLKSPNHEHGLGARVRAERTHPHLLIEEDARSAVIYMYKVFRATLHDIA
jgi:hypothetical protein